jgi:hypothetical protein
VLRFQAKLLPPSDTAASPIQSLLEIPMNGAVWSGSADGMITVWDAKVVDDALLIAM